LIDFEDTKKRAVEFHMGDDNTPDIHSTSTLKEFIDSAHNPGVCGNLLDMKAMSAPVPGLIS
jgi:hypothetical protein